MSQGNLYVLLGLIMIGISVLSAVILEISVLVRKKRVKKLLNKEYN